MVFRAQRYARNTTEGAPYNKQTTETIVMATISVILIREVAEQLTGSGCCGKLEGDGITARQSKLFAESRQQQLDMGLLHRTIKRFFPVEAGKPEVHVVMVDPRNQLYLAPKLIGDVLRHRPGWHAGLRTIAQAFALPAVILNGRIISKAGTALDPDQLCHLIERERNRDVPLVHSS